MNKARKSERTAISETIVVSDMINGGKFGDLANISPEGLMVITDKEIPTQAIFQLELQLPKTIAGSDTLQLGADCLWCRKADNFHRYWAGFQIIDHADSALEQIAILIEDYTSD